MTRVVTYRFIQWKKTARCSPHLHTENRTPRDEERRDGGLWQDQSNNYETPARKLERCDESPCQLGVCKTSGQLITHISHISAKGRQISNAPKLCIIYIYVQQRGYEVGGGGLALGPLIWFLRQWVIVEFLDISYIVHCVCVRRVTDGPRKSLGRRILVAPQWADDDDDDDDSQRLYNWCQRKLPWADRIGSYLFK